MSRLLIGVVALIALIAAILLVRKIFFGESEAYRTYQKFASAMAYDNHEEAKLHAGSDAVKKIVEECLVAHRKVKKFAGAETYVVSIWYTNNSETKGPNGETILNVTQEVRKNPPGSVSVVGDVKEFHQHTVTLSKADGAWKVTVFKDPEIDKMIAARKKEEEEMARLGAADEAEREEETAADSNDPEKAWRSHAGLSAAIAGLSTRLPNSLVDLPPTLPLLNPQRACIAYLSDKQLMVMDEDGGNARQLVDVVRAADPAWSPDGRRIAFTGEMRKPGASANLTLKGLFLVEEDGSNPRLLTDPAKGDAALPAWSPDGTRIAFRSLRSGRNGIHVLATDGTGEHRAVLENSLCHWWLPDGRLAYLAASGDYTVVNADGTEPKKTGKISVQRQGLPEPARDGRSVFFEGNTRPGGGEIYAANLDGTEMKNLTNHEAFDARPFVSPDGKRIVFSSKRVQAIETIHLMEADGSNPRRVTRGNPQEGERPLGWSHDGKKVLFTRGRLSLGTIRGMAIRDSIPDLYVIDAEGANERRLTTTAEKSKAPYEAIWAPVEKLEMVLGKPPQTPALPGAAPVKPPEKKTGLLPPPEKKSAETGTAVKPPIAPPEAPEKKTDEGADPAKAPLDEAAEKECKALLNLAAQYMRVRNTEKAKELYKKIIGKYPGSTYAQDAQNRLTAIE